MATIFLFCSKSDSEKIKSAFEDLLSRIKEKVLKATKMINYLGNTNVLISNGG